MKPRRKLYHDLLSLAIRLQYLADEERQGHSEDTQLIEDLQDITSDIERWLARLQKSKPTGHE